MLHYSTLFIPPCLMAMIAWECSSQGRLCLDPDMAKLTVANAHPESHLAPEALEFKLPLPFRLLGLAKASKRRSKYFSSSQKYVMNQVMPFTLCLLRLVNQLRTPA